MKVYVIDGIIGAGKTSLINKLVETYPNIVPIFEPVEQWCNSGILQLFYADPKRWAYHFQTMVYSSRVQEIVKVYEKTVKEVGTENVIFILERSPLTDTLFMEMLHESGTVTDLEMTSYRQWCDMWNQLVPFSINAFIFLDTPITTAMDRLKIRGRDGENISIEYQTQLSHKHHTFFNGTKTHRGVTVPIHVLHDNVDLVSIQHLFV